MRKTTLAVLLAASGLLAGGCAVAKRVVPTDCSGMEHPVHYVGYSVSDQAKRTADGVTGLPSAFVRHVNESWRMLTVGP